MSHVRYCRNMWIHPFRGTSLDAAARLSPSDGDAFVDMIRKLPDEPRTCPLGKALIEDVRAAGHRARHRLQGPKAEAKRSGSVAKPYPETGLRDARASSGCGRSRRPRPT
ncbi:MAG TPA: hypothetical protein VJ994_13870 [Paracoccaceae bacterium]|nr:hypothetical protein [Paracoccaceae bacterium]